MTGTDEPTDPAEGATGELVRAAQRGDTMAQDALLPGRGMKGAPKQVEKVGLIPASEPSSVEPTLAV